MLNVSKPLFLASVILVLQNLPDICICIYIFIYIYKVVQI